MTKEQFNDNQQAKFRQALATVAGVKSTDVTIDQITETMARRAAIIRVDSSVAVTGAMSADYWQTTIMTADRINAELSKVGLPSAKVLAGAEWAVSGKASRATH